MTDPKVIGKLRTTFTNNRDVYDLSHYDAMTLEEIDIAGYAQLGLNPR